MLHTGTYLIWNPVKQADHAHNFNSTGSLPFSQVNPLINLSITHVGNTEGKRLQGVTDKDLYVTELWLAQEKQHWALLQLETQHCEFQIHISAHCDKQVPQAKPFCVCALNLH